MRFPPAFLDELRARLTPSEVIGRRVALRRQGREWTACCPFHGEKTASFTVNDAKGFYHCFGCGAHGDVIGFVKDFERLSYPEAVERLAQEAGLPLPQVSPEQREQARVAAGLAEVVAAAAQWFQTQLATAPGREARAYLERRGLSAETVRRFGLGYAPDSRTALKDALMKQGIPETRLFEAGLIIRPDQGASYDRFRARVIFPIHDARGRAIAFGGRLMPGHDGPGRPKYLNSPDTELFHKGLMLYGQHAARDAAHARGTLLIAEGYMDVIALHQAGFAFAVAPLGTAITADQLRLAWKVADAPILCLDGDAAGARAMTRAARLCLPLLTPGKSLRFLRLPKGEDPDSLIRSQGPGAFEALLAQPLPLHESLWQSLLPPGGFATPEQRAVFERDILALTGEIKDATVQKHYRDHFRQKLWELGRPAPRQRQGEKGKKSLPPPTRGAAHLDGGLSRDPLRHRERLALAFLVQHPELLADGEVADQLAAMEFGDPFCATLADGLMRYHSEQPAAALPEFLESEGLTGAVAACAKILAGTIPDRATPPAKQWSGHLLDLTILRLERELHEATPLAATDASSEARFLALQSQLAAFRHEKNRQLSQGA